MDATDYILLAIFVALNTTCFILSKISPNSGLETLGNWLVMLTHLLIIPNIVLVRNTRWYLSILVYSTVTSVLYHMAKIGYYDLLSNFDQWDIAAQNVLIMSTFFMLTLSDIPEWAFLVTAGSGVFMGAMGEVDLGPFKVFEFFSGLVFFMLFLYLIIRTIRPIPIRDTMYIGIACACAIVASISFVVATEMDERIYGLVHSIWHCSAYIMLYFALKSIKNPYQQLFTQRRKRDVSL